MRIFCLTCKEPVLDTSAELKLGGPYHGGMFAPLEKWKVSTFKCRDDITQGKLVCPRCHGFFIVGGVLCTEHGTVQPGQTSLDPSQSIMWHEGPAKGQLMHIKPSLLPAEEPEEKKPEEEGEMLKCPNCDREYRNTDSGRPWYEKHVAKCQKAE